MSKYADLAHKIVDMVHATHKEEVRKARTEEKTKKAEEKKIKAEADKDPGRAKYYFGTLCSDRVDFMVGRDFKIDNYEEESVNLFIYPLFEVDDQVSKGYSKKFSYKNL